MSESNTDPKTGGNAGKGEGEAPTGEKTFTQEEVDKIVKERLKRARNEPPADYEELKAKVAEYEKQNGESEGELEKLGERVKALEAENSAMKHAGEVSEWKAEASEKTGVPASILRGDTEEEIEAHAEAVKAAMEKAGVGYPSVDPGNNPASGDMSKAQVLAIEDPIKRRAAIAENIEKFM